MLMRFSNQSNWTSQILLFTDGTSYESGQVIRCASNIPSSQYSLLAINSPCPSCLRPTSFVDRFLSGLSRSRNPSSGCLRDTKASLRGEDSHPSTQTDTLPLAPRVGRRTVTRDPDRTCLMIVEDKQSRAEAAQHHTAGQTSRVFILSIGRRRKISPRLRNRRASTL